MKLNSFLIILFIILKQIFAECFEPIDIFKLEKTIKKVDCGEWINEKGIKKFNNNDGNKLVGGGNETMFQVTFTCLLNDTVLCDKAQKAFDRASNSITNTLKLKEQITVNATFYDFCGEGKNDLECPLEAIATIGETTPKRFYSLLSDDNMERIYPQALVKQFQFPEHPQYDDFDIIIRFNSRVRFYFPEDTTPIGPLQYDFEFTVTHELLHGLGFYSLWQPLPFDETNNLKALCLPIVVMNSGKDGKVDSDNPDEAGTVKESIFDKYMIRLDNGSFISEYTKKMQNYVSSNEEATSKDFLESQFPIMRTMFLLATKPKSLGFLPHNSKSINDAVILETSIPGGYRPGSSVSHVDLSTYNNTSDYLMSFKGTPGKTTNDFISIGGNYPGGIIGPKTKSILESIGYATEEYPEPIKPQPFVKSSAKNNSAVPISAISNSVIFSQFYIMIFVIIILL